MNRIDQGQVQRSHLAIHPLLNQRFSPRAFSDQPVTNVELELLLEAARWAPSSRNEQPWRFLVVRMDGVGYDDMLSVLNESNRRWVRKAPVLIMCMVQNDFTRLAVPNHHAWHDLGLAIGQLTMQATAMGLGVHQLGGFDAGMARERFAIPDELGIVSVIALGYRGDPLSLVEDLRERELNHSARKPLEELVSYGRYQP